MCEATVLPHCVHLLSWGGCQRCDALRVRRRIFEVLRLGTPIRAIRKAGFPPKATSTPALDPDLSGKIMSKSKIRSRSFRLQFQFIQRTPIGWPFAGLLGGWSVGCLPRFSRADPAAFAIAVRMRRQVQQDVFAQIGGEID